jgi:putative aldouronate transport system permease protein
MKKPLTRIILPNAVFALICLFIIIPVLYIVSVSLGTDSDIVEHGYKLIPAHFSLAAYRYYLRIPAQIINGYVVSLALRSWGPCSV